MKLLSEKKGHIAEVYDFANDAKKKVERAINGTIDMQNVDGAEEGAVVDKEKSQPQTNDDASSDEDNGD